MKDRPNTYKTMANMTHDTESMKQAFMYTEAVKRNVKSISGISKREQMNKFMSEVKDNGTKQLIYSEAQAAARMMTSVNNATDHDLYLLNSAGSIYVLAGTGNSDKIIVNYDYFHGDFKETDLHTDLYNGKQSKQYYAPTEENGNIYIPDLNAFIFNSYARVKEAIHTFGNGSSAQAHAFMQGSALRLSSAAIYSLQVVSTDRTYYQLFEDMIVKVPAFNINDARISTKGLEDNDLFTDEHLRTHDVFIKSIIYSDDLYNKNNSTHKTRGDDHVTKQKVERGVSYNSLGFGKNTKVNDIQYKTAKTDTGSRYMTHKQAFVRIFSIKKDYNNDLDRDVSRDKHLNFENNSDQGFNYPISEYDHLNEPIIFSSGTMLFTSLTSAESFLKNYGGSTSVLKYTSDKLGRRIQGYINEQNKIMHKVIVDEKKDMVKSTIKYIGVATVGAAVTEIVERMKDRVWKKKKLANRMSRATSVGINNNSVMMVTNAVHRSTKLLNVTRNSSVVTGLVSKTVSKKWTQIIGKKLLSGGFEYMKGGVPGLMKGLLIR